MDTTQSTKHQRLQDDFRRAVDRIKLKDHVIRELRDEVDRLHDLERDFKRTEEKVERYRRALTYLHQIAGEENHSFAIRVRHVALQSLAP